MTKNCKMKEKRQRVSEELFLVWWWRKQVQQQMKNEIRPLNFTKQHNSLFLKKKKM